MSDTKSQQRDALVSMSKAIKRLLQLANEDRRYKLEAYVFVENALTYAQQELGMGGKPPAAPGESSRDKSIRGESGRSESGRSESSRGESGRGESSRGESGAVTQHVTGQQLCEAIRLFAQQQFGLMAKLVLHNWGVRTTSDFGEIVFNLISIGRLKKSDSDRREDFDHVYDFEDAFHRRFEITATVSDD